MTNINENKQNSSEHPLIVSLNELAIEKLNENIHKRDSVFFTDKELKQLNDLTKNYTLLLSEINRDRDANLNKIRIYWKSYFLSNYASFFENWNTRNGLLFGGRGTGKSYAVALWLIQQCINSVHSVRIVRKTLKDVKLSCIDILNSIIKLLELNSEVEVAGGKSADNSIFFKNGSEILSAGLNDIERLKSQNKFSINWFEEATEIDSRDFEVLNEGMRSNKSNWIDRNILTTNTDNIDHWINTDFLFSDTTANIAYNDVIVGNNNCIAMKTHYKDNVHLSKQVIEVYENYKETKPWLYDRVVNGNGGNIDYSGFIKKHLFNVFNSVSEIPYNDFIAGLIYIDWGYGKSDGSDYTAVVKLHLSKDNSIGISDYFLAKNCPPDDAYNIAISMIDRYSNLIVYDANMTQGATIDMMFRLNSNLKQFGANTQEFRGSADKGLDAFITLLRQGKIHISDILFNDNIAMKQIIEFSGKKNTKKGDHDDLPDAILCGIQSLFKIIEN